MSETVDDNTGAATHTNVDNTEDQAGAPHPAGEYQFNIEESAETAAAATAAAEAAAAAEVAPAPAVAAPAAIDNTNLVCRICGKDSDGGEGGNRNRLLIRFLPVETLAEDTSTNTWDQDIVLHVFCGKTASILPTVNRPELEILSKAGVKNKHGIGPEVNAALARTRCAVLINPQQVASREQEFFLIKEFEAHLMSIRAIHTAAADAAAYHYHQYAVAPEKPVIHKAGQSYRRRDEWALAAPDEHFAAAQAIEDSNEGKVRCACGGSHFPTDTQKGAHSWRAHVMTKRHQKWMEENGMLGAV